MTQDVLFHEDVYDALRSAISARAAAALDRTIEQMQSRGAKARR